MKKDKFYEYFFMILALASLIFLIGIVIILFKEGLPIFKKVNPMDFITGSAWYPTHEVPEFGILSLIAASLLVTIGAMIVAIPLGLGSAIYINELAGSKQKIILKPMVEILASIPSVVYGFFGMMILSPFLQHALNLPTGLCAFTASLTLGIMATPTICSMSEDALNSVPKNLREASLAVGANRWQTITQIVIPAAGSGISTAIILGMSRAIGETMTVLMVSGGAAIIPKSLFDPVRPMTSAIAAEMGEAAQGSDHYHALFAIAIILFIITFVFNILAEIISKRFRFKLGLNK
ncbi:phosphate ABC transporter permease subunit PstC [Candidatus Poribacteria bacterium]|nr:phosphate ABC transporter permease subunit PstC [Candidatus Poribacteria bacterium]